MIIDEIVYYRKLGRGGFAETVSTQEKMREAACVITASAYSAQSSSSSAATSSGMSMLV